MNAAGPTACALSLANCHRCGLLARLDRRHAGGRARCPRCGTALHFRKPNSLSRTWALLLAAYIFYLPANLLPITSVYSVGLTQSDTIMSGVIYFIVTGSWPIALVIFVASILVPLFKMAVLTFLLISVRRKSRWRPRDRARLYRFIEDIGRWSMVDIYVVTILAALVNFGSLGTVQAGPGALFFAAVVVITLLATLSFDPRLIWDALESDDV
ncbi:MAG: paraquat-inducible protein A [Thermodesulfobacteriota bacterium]